MGTSNVLAAQTDAEVSFGFLEDEGFGWMVSACRLPSVNGHCLGQQLTCLSCAQVSGLSQVGTSRL